MKTHFVKHVCRFIINLYKQKAMYIVLAHYSELYRLYVLHKSQLHNTILYVC